MDDGRREKTEPLTVSVIPVETRRGRHGPSPGRPAPGEVRAADSVMAGRIRVWEAAGWYALAGGCGDPWAKFADDRTVQLVGRGGVPVTISGVRSATSRVNSRADTQS